MSSLASFVDRLKDAFEAAGVQRDQCELDSGHLVVKGDTVRVVPVTALHAQYAACGDESSRNKLIGATMDAFVEGAADVPSVYTDCGARLLPQLWPLHKIVARQVTLPNGFELPHCGIHGEQPPLHSSAVEANGLGVVLVCEYLAEGMPAIETPVLSNDLMRWGVSFVDVLQRALDNLRARTKSGPPAENRWEHHPTGCGQSSWQDRFDAARIALFPKLLTARKRPDGVAEAGGHVVAFATPSCVLASMSKNALGLCFMGDTLYLKVAAGDVQARTNQLLSSVPLRLLKMRDNETSHPLRQADAKGFVWKWFPYAPGGPPLKSPGEFSVPVDQGEVDAILNAAEAGKAVPVSSSAGLLLLLLLLLSLLLFC
ncbi:unnamed protein product [Polarella glacialis]|uniref:Uncharacterized protein n=1 Tax=Polarella glacialis TaxID=89957 RepID=A0A813DDR7_POLGL|nr:unnamed protein product [Polarella glacialis]